MSSADLVKVTKAYPDVPDVGSDADLGSVIAEIEFDSLGNRIVKQVKNSADLDFTYHYYYDGDNVVEVRNGSDDVIKQHVWGLLYIDELIQVGLNDDPADATEDLVESLYYALHETNFSVAALVDDQGVLVERYAYAAYGERTVYFASGTTDTGPYAPAATSRRWQVSSVNQPYGLTEIGFQGLLHEDETGLVQNRMRHLHVRLGRFLERDRLGYIDGMSLYEYVGSDPINYLDPYGEARFRLKKMGRKTINGKICLTYIVVIERRDWFLQKYQENVSMNRVCLCASKINGSGSQSEPFWDRLMNDQIDLYNEVLYRKGVVAALELALDQVPYGRAAKLLQEGNYQDALKEAVIDTLGIAAGGAGGLVLKHLDEGLDATKAAGRAMRKCFTAGTLVLTNDGYKPIETIRVGDRVLTTPRRHTATDDSSDQEGGDDDDEDDLAGATAVDPATWRLVKMRIDYGWADGTPDVLQVESLLPVSWIQATGAQPGALVAVPLELREMDLPERSAEVLAIEPCPPIQPGPGRVVLTTVTNLNRFVFKLTVQDDTGRQASVQPTGSHKFYSRTRRAWTDTCDLEAGEQLATRGGNVTVVALERTPGMHRVYNMTVEADHVYCVSRLEVLSHNNCGGEIELRVNNRIIKKDVGYRTFKDANKRLQRQIKKAKAALSRNKAFKRWFHKHYKQKGRIPGAKTNPDMEGNDILVRWPKTGGLAWG